MGEDSRGAHAKTGTGGSDRRVLPGFDEKLLGHAGELIEIPAAGILKLEGKSSRGTESSDGRGVKSQNQCLRNLRELPVRGADQGFHVILRPLSFVPVMQWQKHRRRVRPSGPEDKVLAGQRIGRMDRGN